MKLILTVLVLAAILYVLWPGVRHVLRDAKRSGREPAQRDAEAGAEAPRRPDLPGIEADDLVKCRACGTWVPAAAAPPCERPECPARTRAPVA